MDVVLRDGSTVQLRDIRSGDDAALRTFLDGLSHDSLYFRFFTIPKSSAAEVSRLSAADGRRAVTLVAQLGGRLCAVANYVGEKHDPTRAEVAFAISDQLQGKGIATRML